jgi:hypothetical protein
MISYLLDTLPSAHGFQKSIILEGCQVRKWWLAMSPKSSRTISSR